MTISIKKIVLWRSEVENKPGILAGILEPLANAGADLHVVMGYRYTGDPNKAAIEIYPVSGKRSVAAAQGAGMSASTIPTLLVEGDNRRALGHAISKALSEAGINLNFLCTQVIGRRYSAVVGFESENDARKAASLIKKVTAVRKK